MHTLIIAIFLCLTVPPLAAQHSESKAPSGRLTIGVGVVSLPAYPGSNDRRTLALPIVALDLGRAYVGGGSAGATGGAGIYLLRAAQATWSVDVGGTLNRPANRSDDLQGFEDRGYGSTIGSGVAVRVGALEFGVSGAVGMRKAVGMSGRATIGMRHGIGSRLLLAASVGMTMADDRNMAWDFGVSADDALGSGLAAFAPRGGLREVTASLAPSVLLSSRLMAVTFANVTRLGDRTAESPLVRRRTTLDFGAALVMLR